MGIELKGISKSWHQQQILRKVSFKCDAGETLVLLGPSGAGKSSLLRLMNLLDTPDEGELLIAGERFSFPAAAQQADYAKRTQLLRGKVGMVFQQYHLWPHLTVEQNLLEAPVKVLGMSKKEAQDKAGYLLSQLKLAEKRQVWPSGTLISGNMQNLGKGTTEIVNNGQEGITISGTTINHNGDTTLSNNAGDVNVSGKLKNENGTLNITNNGNKIEISKSGTVENDNNLAITNYGQGGTDIQGTVKNTGTSNVVNKAGLLNIGGSFANKGNATFTNDGTNFNIDGTVANTGGTLSMLNNNGGLNVNSTAVVSNSGTGVTTITNHGTDGLNVSGKISSDGDLTMTNTGAKGINIASSGHVTGNDNNIYVNNNSKGGVNVKGLVNAKNNVNIQSTNGNVVIGDNTANNNYVTAGKNIDIAINNGSLLNYGVEKVLLNA